MGGEERPRLRVLALLRVVDSAFILLPPLEICKTIVQGRISRYLPRLKLTSQFAHSPNTIQIQSVSTHSLTLTRDTKQPSFKKSISYYVPFIFHFSVSILPSFLPSFPERAHLAFLSTPLLKIQRLAWASERTYLWPKQRNLRFKNPQPQRRGQS